MFLIESIARGLWIVGLAKVGPSSPTAPPRSALRDFCSYPPALLIDFYSSAVSRSTAQVAVFRHFKPSDLNLDL
jgi:hypothetical protein